MIVTRKEALAIAEVLGKYQRRLEFDIRNYSEIALEDLIVKDVLAKDRIELRETEKWITKLQAGRAA